MREPIREWMFAQGRSQPSAATRIHVSRATVARLLVEAPEEPERRYRRTARRMWVDLGRTEVVVAESTARRIDSCPQAPSPVRSLCRRGSHPSIMARSALRS
ncbi:MAG TPA: hypothetical protein VE338_22070 [Ktedonobacterales bacterium]|nr:hypothetical protein [Ktedonobacterales bacterium]